MLPPRQGRAFSIPLTTINDGQTSTRTWLFSLQLPGTLKLFKVTFFYRYMPINPTPNRAEPVSVLHIDLGVYNAEDRRFWDYGQRKGCSKLGDFYLVTNLFPCQSLLHDNKTSLTLYTLHANAPLRCTYLLTHLKKPAKPKPRNSVRGKFDTRQAIFCACSKRRRNHICFQEGAGSSKFYGHTAATLVNDERSVRPWLPTHSSLLMLWSFLLKVCLGCF